MTEALRVRVYNVRFGDALLVTVPDRDPQSKKVTTRRILIDFGNAPKVASPEGGDDSVFGPVFADIEKELGGEPLDLYVMTHEHLDHAQGLAHVAWKLHKQDFAKRFRVRNVWLTASADPDYYADHPEAEKQKLAFQAQHGRLRQFLAAHRLSNHSALLEMLANNDPTKTGQCVEFLRGLNPSKTTYVYRGLKLGGKHPFREVKFELWAPEEDTSIYYGKFQPLPFGAASAGAKPAADVGEPPAGVDIGAYLNLRRMREDGIADNLLTIDKAANNTSVVLLLEWRKRKLLFAGDAELRSWREMSKRGLLKPVDFLKVAHHGSHNGTPEGEIFDAILPESPGASSQRKAAISTWVDTYSGIPHAPTNERLSKRAKLTTTLEHKEKLYFDLEFAPA